MLRPLATIATLCACASLSWSADQSELTFIDVRLAGGIHDNRLFGSDLTIMCGDIGNKDPHVIDTWSDVGIILGLRGLYDSVDAKLDGGTKYKARLIGAALMLGLGVYLDENDHMELAAGYGKGETNDATVTSLHRNGSFTSIFGELGLYHTFDTHLQFGLNVGYALDRVKINPTVPGGSRTSGRAAGVDLNVEIGFRF